MSKKNIGFHIESDDYFGSLATVISLIKDLIKNGEIKQTAKNAKEMADNLIYLQDNYKIVKKE